MAKNTSTRYVLLSGLVLILIGNCTDIGAPLPCSQTLSAKKVDFGLVAFDYYADANLWISNGGPGTLTGKASVADDTSNSFSIVGSAEYEVGVNDTAALTIRFTPTDTLFVVGAWLVLECNDTVTAIDSLPLLGEGTTEILPGMTLSDAILDFGSLTPDQGDSSRTLTITGDGTVPVEISNISLTGSAGSAFSIPSLSPFSIPVGQQTTVTVTFSPTAPGVYIDTLTITANTPTSPVIVELLGTQMEPVSYTASVQPVFNASCAMTDCHTRYAARGGLVLESYSGLMADTSAPVVIPGDGTGSPLVKRLRSPAVRRMPPKEYTALSDSLIGVIELWIDQGANDN